jgi:rare lipoprotein A
MANGKPFVPEAMTCATLKYPFGTRLRVTNTKTGASVVVTCTDRGPAGWLKPYRCVDLSSGAFSRIADLTSGLVSVTMRVEN